MRQDQVFLQRRGIFRRDLEAGELAEAGVHAIDRRAALAAAAMRAAASMPGRASSCRIAGALLAVEAFELAR
jgi:hypothetical protein